MQSAQLRIGSRSSPLALIQANAVRDRLIATHRLDPASVEIVPIRTSGDRIVDRPLAEAGGKGLFTKEIEDALLAGTIDLAVHSAKDMPTILPDGLVLAAFPPREDPRDAFVSDRATEIGALPDGAVLGTASVRRRAMALHHRPDLKIVDMRGNVETRLAKLADGLADATILALAGLKRLGLADRAASIIDTSVMLPAVGQGAVTVEIRTGDTRIGDLVAAIDDPVTHRQLTAERAFLAVLDGSCRTPIGGHATVNGEALDFVGMIVAVDGSKAKRVERRGSLADAERLGRDAGEELLALGGADLIGAV